MPDNGSDRKAGVGPSPIIGTSPAADSTPTPRSNAGRRVSGGRKFLDKKWRDWSWLLEKHEKVVSRPEAKKAGVSQQSVKRRLTTGKWQRMQRGVYATFTGPPSRQAKLWAAVARAGPGAMLSHESAAELYGITDRRSSKIHVTVSRGRHPGQKKIPGIEIHRTDLSSAAAVKEWELPRTSVEDTVLDLVATAKSLDEAYSLVSRAIWNEKTSEEDLLARLAVRKRYARRAWLRDAIADVSEGAYFPLERLYLRDVERAHGLPAACRQAKRQLASGNHYKDILYEEYNVCVELDGGAYHGNDRVFADKRRDNLNLAADDTRTFRFGYVDLTARPCECVEMVVAALRRGGWKGIPRACKREDCQIGQSATRRGQHRRRDAG